jgi:hypothetical protein
MNKLIFKMSYSGKRWADYLTEILGKEIAEKCKTESNATAKNHNARIILYNFDGNKSIINSILQNENTISAFIVRNNKIQKQLK